MLSELFGKKVIGILARPTEDFENDKQVAVMDDYRRAVIKKGCVPYIICPLADVTYVDQNAKDIPPLTEEEKEIYRKIVDRCDGILITGGYSWYNYDEFVVRYAIEKDKPVLGICMGMQLLAALDNEESCLMPVSNLSDFNHRQENQKYVHDVMIEEDSYLRKIVNQDRIKVNSKHRYYVSQVKQAKISAYSPDGIPEAIEFPNKKFVIGVQWHPEKMIEYDEYANKILDEFVRNMQK